MIRTVILARWLAYGAATACVALVQGFVLQYIRLLDVMPFLYPMVAAMVAMFEGPFAGTSYCLALGVVCDLLLPASLPCFYTLIFPLVGLCAGLVAESWLPAGLPCSYVVTVLAFALTDAFHALVLAMSGKAAWSAAAELACRETAAALLFVPLVYLLFRRVYRRVHAED